MAQSDLSWSVPVMRIGYAGRGLVYLVVAGFSLYAIWQGGTAQGTSKALTQLENTAWGGVILFLIFLGMLAYAIWRAVDCIWDLEAYGSGAKGVVGRIGMIVTGITHLFIGILAFSLLFTGGGSAGGGSGGRGGSGGGGSSIGKAVGAVMQWPGGRWIIGIVGAIIIAAGIYYIHKGWAQTYLKFLRANRFTMSWNGVLRAGLVAQGVVVGVIGLLFIFAALTANPGQAGGIGQAFSWLSQQAYGQILVTIICIGLLGFAVFCFVNAAYRIVPKVAGDDIETLGRRLAAQAKRAAPA